MKELFDLIESKLKSWFFQIQRAGVELVLLFIIGMVLFVFSREIVEYDEAGVIIKKYCSAFGYQFILPPAFQLFLFKVFNFSASQIHAFLVRKWMFPYIRFDLENRPTHAYMVVALHVSAAYLYAIGG